MRLTGTGNGLIGTTSETGLSGSGNLKTNGAILTGGSITSGGKILVGAGTFSAGDGSLYYDSTTNGLVLIPKAGGTNNLLIGNVSGISLLRNPAGTADVYLAGSATAKVVVEAISTASAVGAGGGGALQVGGNVNLSGNAGGSSYFGGDVQLRKDTAGLAAISIDNRNTAGTEILYFTEDGVSANYAYIGRVNSAGSPARQVRFGAGDAVSWNFVNGNVNVSSTTSASNSYTGALVVGNGSAGSAAVNVAIGGGNINAGGTGTFGDTITLTKSGDGVINIKGGTLGSHSAVVRYGTTATDYWQMGRGPADGSANFQLYDYQGTPGVRFSVASGTGAATFAGAVTVNGALTNRTDQNAATDLYVRNGTTGTAASSSLVAYDGTYLTQLGLTNTGFTTSGPYVANVSHLSSNAPAGLRLISQAGEMRFYSSNTLALTLAASTQAATFAGAVTTSSATLSGAGAIPITTSLVKFTSTGGSQALTLANGVDGQRLTIVHDVDGGSGVLTPTTKTGFSTVTFTNAGDTVSLVYVTTRGWMVTGSYLATVAP
jgi:hypothetical protein